LCGLTTADVYVLWNGDAAIIPWAGRREGVDAVLTFFGTVGQHLDVRSVNVIDRFEAPTVTTIVLEGHWRVKANGREVKARVANIFRFDGDKISGYEVCSDTGRFMVALAA
jgi:ketosteroid isomerase-like protein